MTGTTTVKYNGKDYRFNLKDVHPIANSTDKVVFLDYIPEKENYFVIACLSEIQFTENQTQHEQN